MLNEFITHLNWVDILALIVIFRIGYAAMKTGIIIEVFKFCGVICAIYVSSHYYIVLSDFFKSGIPEGLIPVQILDFLSFILLAVFGYLIFVPLRNICRTFIKFDSPSTISKWLGLGLGIIRGYFISAILIFAMIIPGVTYFNNSSSRSYLGSRILEVQPGVYTWLWNNLGSKLMKSEQLNPAVNEIQESLKQQ